MNMLICGPSLEKPLRSHQKQFYLISSTAKHPAFFQANHLPLECSQSRFSGNKHPLPQTTYVVWSSLYPFRVQNDIDWATIHNPSGMYAFADNYYAHNSSVFQQVRALEIIDIETVQDGEIDKESIISVE